MVANQKLLDALKELNNLSSIDVKDPENEDFESARISAFDDGAEGDAGIQSFGNLRKKVNDVGELEEKYAGKKASRKSLDWGFNDDSSSGDNDMETDDNDANDDNFQDTYHHDENKDMNEYLMSDYLAEAANGSDVNGDHDGDNDVEVDENNVENNMVDDDNGDSDDDDDDDDDEDDDNEENIEGYDEDDDDVNDHTDDDDDANDDDGGGDDDGDDGDITGEDIDCSMKIDFNMLPDDLKGGTTQESHNNANGDIDNFAISQTDDDVTKGQATKFQLDILDKLLESRIRLQKSLNLCNQLPQHDTMACFREQAGPQVKESYESARILVKELLSKLFKLQEILCETNSETSSILCKGDTSSNPDDEEIPSDTEDEEENNDTEKKDVMEGETGLNLPSKRKHTLALLDYGEEIIKRHKATQPFQEATVKKWHEKTRLASSVINSKNFASFDKSVLQQIKQVLIDKDKLIKRTQLSRVPLRILGKQNNEELNEMKNEDNANLHLKDYNENIFDDGDFYHEMLKELIERKSDINADDPIAAGRRWLELQKLRSKIKKKVDTRASKGRKTRYDVHPKLVNFMAPQNVGSVSNQARNNLFSSLFDQRPNVSSY